MTERTLVIIKSDGVERRLVGEIIKRFEQIGLTLKGMKMLKSDEDLIERHYTMDPEWLRITGEKSIKNSKEKGHPLLSEVPEEAGRIVLNTLKAYLTKGPAIAMIWSGPHAVAVVRKLVGSTEPLSSDVGTIRGDFVLDSYELSNREGRAIRNLVHASSSIKEAEAEIAHWFSKSDIL